MHVKCNGQQKQTVGRIVMGFSFFSKEHKSHSPACNFILLKHAVEELTVEEILKLQKERQKFYIVSNIWFCTACDTGLMLHKCTYSSTFLLLAVLWVHVCVFHIYVSNSTPAQYIHNRLNIDWSFQWIRELRFLDRIAWALIKKAFGCGLLFNRTSFSVLYNAPFCFWIE